MNKMSHAIPGKPMKMSSMRAVRGVMTPTPNLSGKFKNTQFKKMDPPMGKAPGGDGMRLGLCPKTTISSMH
jgi:hypothetical protein